MLEKEHVSKYKHNSLPTKSADAGYFGKLRVCSLAALFFRYFDNGIRHHNDMLDG